VRQLVIDAGPLIALFAAKDPDHSACRDGFEQLMHDRVQVLAPIPVMFEVYKWLLYKSSRTIALQALEAMQLSLQGVPLLLSEFAELAALVNALSSWNGSLEDAMVFWLSQRYACPIWTLNYRDFSIFSSLEFWTPAR
jgi:predicted nucleic acid-binding protein